MLRFAANLSMLYPELAFLDRIDAAALDGFEGVECLFPYAHGARDIRSRLDVNGVRQVLFNCPPGNWDAGERGIACIPGREAEHRTGVLQALEYASLLGCRQLHVMAGIVPSTTSRSQAHETYLENLAWAASQAAAEGCNVLVEPLNGRDMPGYLLSKQEQAHDIVTLLNVPNVKVQMDLYHCQIVEGDVATRLRKWLPSGHVGHIQVAGVPERHEPDIGELNHSYLFSVIREEMTAGRWDGWIGCEYRPSRGNEPGGTSKGLSWLRQTSPFWRH